MKRLRSKNVFVEICNNVELWDIIKQSFGSINTEKRATKTEKMLI